MIEWMILLVISHQCHSVLMHHSAIFILRTESYKTIAMHCRQKTICISASFSPFFMILIVFNSREAHLSNGIRTRKNGYVLAEIWSAQAESKKHCNSFVRHCRLLTATLSAFWTPTWTMACTTHCTQVHAYMRSAHPSSTLFGHLRMPLRLQRVSGHVLRTNGMTYTSMYTATAVKIVRTPVAQDASERLRG